MARFTVTVTYTVLPAPRGSVYATFDKTAYTAEGSLVDQTGRAQSIATITVPMRFIGFTDPPQIRVDHTNNALRVGNRIVSSSFIGGGLELDVRSANDLGLGTFHDDIAIQVCLDANCTYPVEGSPYRVTFDYVIKNSGVVSGANGYTWRVFDQQRLSGLAWEPASQRLLGTRTTYGPGLEMIEGTLLAINPTSGATEWTLRTSTSAFEIEVDRAGQFAYVAQRSLPATITKVRLADRTVVQTLTLPDNEMVISGLHIAPDDPNVLVVTAARLNAEALFLFGASGALLDRRDFTARVVSAAWGDDRTTLYAYVSATNELLKFSPTPTSFGTVSTRVADLDRDRTGWSSIRYENGLIFESRGGIYDTRTNEIVAALQLLEGGYPVDFGTVTPDAAHRRFFYMYRYGRAVLEAFDDTTYQSIARIETSGGGLNDLIRWGDDGLALITTSRDGLLVLQGSFVSGK